MNQTEALYGEEAREAVESREGPAQGQLDGTAHTEGQAGIDGRDGADSPSQDDRNRNGFGQSRDDVGNQDSGFVYLIKSRTHGFYKIGFSVNPAERLKQVAPVSAGLELLHTIPTSNPRWLESIAHRRFAPSSCGGEWFLLTESQVQEFQSVPSGNAESDLPAEWMVESPATERPRYKPDEIRFAKGSFVIRLPSEFGEQLRLLTSKTRRTLTVEAQIALDNHLRANGIEPPQ